MSIKCLTLNPLKKMQLLKIKNKLLISVTMNAMKRYFKCSKSVLHVELFCGKKSCEKIFRDLTCRIRMEHAYKIVLIPPRSKFYIKSF